MVAAARTTSTVVFHMSVAFVVMYIATGSTAFGGVAALIEPLCVVALAPLHEKAWEFLEHRLARRQVMREPQAALPPRAMAAQFHPAPAARH